MYTIQPCPHITADSYYRIWSALLLAQDIEGQPAFTSEDVKQIVQNLCRRCGA